MQRRGGAGRGKRVGVEESESVVLHGWWWLGGASGCFAAALLPPSRLKLKRWFYQGLPGVLSAGGRPPPRVNLSRAISKRLSIVRGVGGWATSEAMDLHRERHSNEMDGASAADGRQTTRQRSVVVGLLGERNH
eukprot:9504054-Pyramimonas_sp.AAC.2